MKYLVSRKTALIIQDLQNDLISKGGALVSPDAPEHAKNLNVVAKVKILAETARSLDVPIIHIHSVVNKNASGLKQNAPFFWAVKKENALVSGSWGAAPVEGLEPREGDYVIEKMRMNGFYNTNLDNLLRSLGAETIIIAGAWTNITIEHTARHGADAGYEIVVTSDGASTINDERRSDALNYAITQIGTAASCEEIGNALKKGAGPVQGGIQAHSRVMHELAGGLELIATGFMFTEGPVWNRERSCLLFSDILGNVRRRWSEREGVVEIMNPSHRCNGMTYDAEGNLIVCEHNTSTVVREYPDGARETIASHYKGKELNSPNDVVVGPDGSIYFTDPPYGRTEIYGIERERELDFQGVYRIPPGGGEPLLLVDDFNTPNGLCFSVDNSLLYINDTRRAHIRVFDVQPDGNLANGRMFFENIGSGVSPEGAPDGMKCDEKGNIYVCGPGGVWVISPDAIHLGVIGIPEKVGNLHWGNSDWRTLYVAASTSIYRMKMHVRGKREGFMK